MIEVETLIIFVMIVLDILFLVVGGYLLPIIGSCFSFLFGAILLGDEFAPNVMFSPYLQVMLMAVGAICILKAALTYRGD